MEEILSVVLRHRDRFLVTHLTSSARSLFSGVPSALPGGRKGIGPLEAQTKNLIDKKFGLNIVNMRLLAARRHVLSPKHHLSYIVAEVPSGSSDKILLQDAEIQSADWLSVRDAIDAMPTLYTVVAQYLLGKEFEEERSYAEQDISFFGQLIKEGKLVAFPTETVYGLGANAYDAGAVSNIFATKERPADNPLIVHVSSRRQLRKIVSYVPKLAKKLYDIFSPGPMTILLKRKSIIPDIVTAHSPLVGVRIPNNSLALELIDAARVPIAAPSANKSGKPSATHHQHVIDAFSQDDVHVLKGGMAREGVESTVVKVFRNTVVILRQGAISKEDIATALPEATVVIAGSDDASVKASPGTRYKHYAPKGSVHIIAYDESISNVESAIRSVLLHYPDALVVATDNVLQQFGDEKTKKFSLGKTHDDARMAAKRLYSALLFADAQGSSDIIVQSFKEEGIGRTVMERMTRAAQK